MKSIVRMGALVLALCLSLPALGMSLDAAKSELEAAKASGHVGETPTGYLAVVKAGDHAAEIVAAINEARRAEYARIAEKHGISVTKVEAVAGQKAIEKTPEGQFIQVNGSWVRK